VNAQQRTATGTVVAIYLTDKAGQSPRAVKEALAVAGRGLEGDRYFEGFGTFSRWPGEGRALSLIEQEALDDLSSAQGLDLTAGQHRRNLVTRGIDLTSLVGCQFRIGNAILRGTRECTVCGYLNRASGLKLAEALRGRGGLRADVIADGDISAGDTISAL
jgi:MOSC domain-containing protein YiiM